MRTEDPMKIQNCYDPGKTQELINYLKFPDFHVMCLIWWNLQINSNKLTILVHVKTGTIFFTCS